MTEPHTCLNCGRTSQQRHLIAGEWRGQPFYVCGDCLPILIHDPEQIGHGGEAEVES